MLRLPTQCNLRGNCGHVPLPLTLSDPSDLKFIEVAVAGGADAIVTGNARDFSIAEGQVATPIVSPRRLIERLRNGWFIRTIPAPPYTPPIRPSPPAYCSA